MRRLPRGSSLARSADPLHDGNPIPPGTSKWNKIEHRLFCHLTQNWRGKPLRTFETLVQLIGHTRTTKGLKGRAKLDSGKYPTGVVITKSQMKELVLYRNAFCGDWNHELRPKQR